jgi:hypothetical protein
MSTDEIDSFLKAGLTFFLDAACFFAADALSTVEKEASSSAAVYENAPAKPDAIFEGCPFNRLLFSYLSTWWSVEVTVQSHIFPNFGSMYESSKVEVSDLSFIQGNSILLIFSCLLFYLNTEQKKKEISIEIKRN